MKTLLIYLLFLPCVVSGPDKSDWSFKKEKDGITIYTRHSDASSFNDLRIEMDLPGNVAQISSILADVNNYYQWAYATKSSVLIRKLNDHELIYYSEIGAPWPVSNRDFYADMKITFDAASRSLNVTSVGMKDYQPEKKNLVRVPMSKGIWNISTKSDRSIHLQYILQMNPGGSLPAWILNMFSTKGPLETFTNLKKKMSDLNP